MPQIPVGQTIPVVAQLGEGETDKFVRAWVIDANGNPIAGSPVDLAHIALGLYQNTDLQMPTTALVIVQCQAFDDSGYTVPSETYISTKIYTGVVTEGEVVPVVAQLGDGSTDKYVRAWVRNAAGTILGTLDLTAGDRGLYRDDSLVMPETDFVTVQFRVYSDSDYSVPTDDLIESQVFTGVPPSDSVSAFKAYFFRDFPYGDSMDRVMDEDIERALEQAECGASSELFCDEDQYEIGVKLLAAHYLVMNLRASSQGISGQFSWLQQSKSVSSVSESFTIPERIQKNPSLALLTKTNYGAQYLAMILPSLCGQIFTVEGGTRA